MFGVYIGLHTVFLHFAGDDIHISTFVSRYKSRKLSECESTLITDFLTTFTGGDGSYFIQRLQFGMLQLLELRRRESGYGTELGTEVGRA